METIYTEQDADRSALSGTVAVIGYGSQGRSHARNLRDSGFDVIVGARAGGGAERRARNDGFRTVSPAEAAKEASLVALLTPDMSHREVYAKHIAPNLAPGAALLVAHGFSVHYGEIVPRRDIDVVLVAPKGPGALVRREYEIGRGVPSVYAVYQDRSGNAEQLALTYCAGIGGARQNAIRTTFKEETETDLFGEQAVLCGGATKLVQAGWETLVEAGYQPEVAYYECLHELKLIVDLFYEGGITRMHEFISETAQYGALTRGTYVVDDNTRAQMKKVLTEIQDGTFARQWIAEYAAGNANYKALKQGDLEHPIEAVGRKLRANMKWLSTAPQAAPAAVAAKREAQTEAA